MSPVLTSNEKEISHGRVSWQADTPQRRKILELVEAIKPKSGILREELSKPPK